MRGIGDGMEPGICERSLLYSKHEARVMSERCRGASGLVRESIVDTMAVLKNRWFMLSAAGLAACLILFGEGSSISSRISVDTFAIMTSDDPLTGGITIMAAFLLALVCSGFAARWIESVPFLVVDGLVNVLGVLALFSGMLGFGPSGELSKIGGLILGFGSSFLLIAWAVFLIPRGAKTSSLCLAVSLLIVIAFDVLAKALVDVALAIAIALVCAASPVLLRIAAKRFGAEEQVQAIEEYRGVVPAWLSFASIGLYAVVMGGIQVGGSSLHAQVDGVGTMLVASGLAVDAGILVAAIVVFVGVRYLRGNNMGFYRLTILALLAVSLYLSAVLSANWSTMNIVTMTMTRMLLFAYIWTMFSTPAKTMSPLRLFSVGWLLFLAVNHLSTRIGQTVAGTEAPLIAYELVLAIGLLLLFVFEFTPILTERYNDGPERTEAKKGASSDAFARRIADLVEQGGLTPREQDVLVAMARGRSAQYIADTFVVSKETARTHIRHVYQKLDVHSREELMDLVESVEPSIA